MPEELPFTVEIWNDANTQPARTLARCARVDVAIGAFEASTRAFPDNVIQLRESTRVVLSHRVRRTKGA
jgi:hypothetical protein